MHHQLSKTRILDLIFPTGSDRLSACLSRAHSLAAQRCVDEGKQPKQKIFIVNKCNTAHAHVLYIM